MCITELMYVVCVLIIAHQCCSVLYTHRHLSTTSVDDLSASDVRSSPEMSGPILRHKRTHSVQAMVGSNMYRSEENLAAPRPESVSEKKRPLSVIERASSCFDLAVDFEGHPERKRHVSWEGGMIGWEEGSKREERGVSSLQLHDHHSLFLLPHSLRSWPRWRACQAPLSPPAPPPSLLSQRQRTVKTALSLVPLCTP